MLQRQPWPDAAPTGGGQPSQAEAAALDEEEAVARWGGGLSLALWSCATLLALYFT